MQHQHFFIHVKKKNLTCVVFRAGVVVRIEAAALGNCNTINQISKTIFMRVSRMQVKSNKYIYFIHNNFLANNIQLYFFVHL